VAKKYKPPAKQKAAPRPPPKRKTARRCFCFGLRSVLLLVVGTFVFTRMYACVSGSGDQGVLTIRAPTRAEWEASGKFEIEDFRF